MPETFTFEEAADTPETFSFEEAVAPTRTASAPLRHAPFGGNEEPNIELASISDLTSIPTTWLAKKIFSHPEAPLQGQPAKAVDVHQSVVGISPEGIPSGFDIEPKNTAEAMIFNALGGKLGFGVLSAAAKTGAGLGQFLTSPQGLTEMGIAATPAAPAMLAKWLLDMAEGAATAPEKAIERYEAGDYQGTIDELTGGVAALAGGVGAGKGLAHKIAPKPAPMAKPPIIPLTQEAVKNLEAEIQGNRFKPETREAGAAVETPGEANRWGTVEAVASAPEKFSFEEAKEPKPDRIDEITAVGESRRQAATEEMKGLRPSPLDWLTEAEQAELHTLQQALPSAGQIRAEAQARLEAKRNTLSRTEPSPEVASAGTAPEVTPTRSPVTPARTISEPSTPQGGVEKSGADILETLEAQRASLESKRKAEAVKPRRTAMQVQTGRLNVRQLEDAIAVIDKQIANAKLRTQTIEPQQTPEKPPASSEPLSAGERVELNELRFVREQRGKLGRLNSERLAELEARELVVDTAGGVGKTKSDFTSPQSVAAKDLLGESQLPQAPPKPHAPENVPAPVSGGTVPQPAQVGGKKVEPLAQAEIAPSPGKTAPGEKADVGPGMGAAIPEEFEPPKQFTTSVKNATADAGRAARGLEPLKTSYRITNTEAWETAMRRIDEKPHLQDELIAELAAEPRATDPVETAMLLHRRIDLRNEYEKALHNWKKAFESDDMALAADEAARVRSWSARLSDFEAITKNVGTREGQSLQARKMMANEDFSLSTMVAETMEAKGRPLRVEEHAALLKAHERIAELEKQLQAELQRQADTDLGASVDEAMKETRRESSRGPRTRDPEAEQSKVVSRIQALSEKGEVQAMTPLVQRLARLLWERGIREREPMTDALHGILKDILPDWTREKTQRAFSGYGDFKALSKAEIDIGLRDLRGQTQQVLKIEALENRKPLEKTGVERREPSNEERRLIKVVNELKRLYGVVVTDPATQLKSALQSRKTYYTHRLADLKHEIATRERIVKTKSPSPTDAELDALKTELKEVKREHDEIFGERELTDAQRLKMAISAAERNQAEWQHRLDRAQKGDFSKPDGPKKVTSAELEAMRARTEAIKEQVQELKDLATPKKTPEQIALQSLKARMKTRTADYLDRLAKGDFVKRERTPVPLDAEARGIKAQLDQAKERYQTGLQIDRWNKMSVFQKTGRGLVDLYDAARALMTTGEFSFILRQGKVASLAHPIRTARALPDTFRALLASDVRARAIDDKIHTHPDAEAAKRAKLHLVEEGASLHRSEEIMMGRLVGHIPIVKNFNQAARVFLNKVRFDMWQAMRKSMSKSGTPTLAEDKQIAMFVNEATGRGGLGKVGEPAAVFLGRAMFSPRYYVSRFQLLSGHSLWGGTMRTRKVIAMEYARASIGLVLYYTALKMYFGKDADEIELDPRSSDFGKVRLGDTRLDPLAGLAQATTFISRMASGETKTLRGRVVPLRGNVPYGGKRATDVAARHLRSKLHPVPVAIASLFDGTDLAGDEATLAGEGMNMVSPITYMDIYEALKEQDLDDATALSILAFLGEGLSTYERRRK